MQDPIDIADVMTLQDWREKYASHLFKNESQLQWFVRNHRRRLLESGAYIPGRGRRASMVHRKRLDQEVAAIYFGVEDNAA